MVTIPAPSRRGRADLVPPGLLIALAPGSWKQYVTWGSALAGKLGLVECPLAQLGAEHSGAELPLPGKNSVPEPAWAAGDTTGARATLHTEAPSGARGARACWSWSPVLTVQVYVVLDRSFLFGSSERWHLQFLNINKSCYHFL